MCHEVRVQGIDRCAGGRCLHRGVRSRAAFGSRAAAAGVSGWQLAGPPPAADAGPSAAPYLITNLFEQQPQPIEVKNARSGKILATVPPPAGSAEGFTGLEAAGDDRRTGRLLAVSPPAEEGGMGSSCLAAWSDPSGAQVVVGCLGVGILEPGRWHRADLNLPASEFWSPVFMAW